MNALLSKIFCAQRVLKNTPPQGEIPDDETLLRRTFRVAWPSTLESFLVALVGMVDTIMVSRLGAYAIAAVGLTTQPKFICLAVFMSLNIAVSALVARRKGEGDREGANRVLAQSMVLTVMFAIVITAIAILFAEPILRLTGSNAETHESAAAYFRIISAGMIFNVMSMVINCNAHEFGFQWCQYCLQLSIDRRAFWVSAPWRGRRRSRHSNWYNGGTCYERIIRSSSRRLSVSSVPEKTLSP